MVNAKEVRSSETVSKASSSLRPSPPFLTSEISSAPPSAPPPGDVEASAASDRFRREEDLVPAVPLAAILTRAFSGADAAIMNLRRLLKKSTQLTLNARRMSVRDAGRASGASGASEAEAPAFCLFPPDPVLMDAVVDARLIPAAMNAAHACHSAGFCG